jgi:hypothetical protein
MKKKTHKSGARLRGFFRLNIVDYKDGKEKIVGDSGWVENQVTNDGINQYLVNWLLGDTANAKSVKYITLGTGTVPASNATALAGEITHRTNRETVSTSVVSSRTAQFTAAFSSNGFITTTVTLQNIGLFNTTNTAAGTIFAGNTYATSTCASNQAVNATYQIRFTSA